MWNTWDRNRVKYRIHDLSSNIILNQNFKLITRDGFNYLINIFAYFFITFLQVPMQRQIYEIFIDIQMQLLGSWVCIKRQANWEIWCFLVWCDAFGTDNWKAACGSQRRLGGQLGWLGSDAFPFTNKHFCCFFTSFIRYVIVIWWNGKYELFGLCIKQARPLCARAMEDGNFDELADPRLEKNYLPHEMARMVACAAASVRHSARRRPKMSQVENIAAFKQVQETRIKFLG
jgi:hypothetical protein